MQAAAQLRHDAKTRPIVRCPCCQLFGHREKAAYAARAPQASLLWPGDDHLVANIVVDLAAVLCDRRTDIEKKAAQQPLHAEVAEPLR